MRSLIRKITAVICSAAIALTAVMLPQNAVSDSFDIKASADDITGLYTGAKKTPEPVELSAEELESISEGASHVMSQINSIDIKSVWSNVTEITQSAATLTAGANELVESSRASLGGILAEMEAASASLRSLVEDLRENPSLILRGRDSEALPETSR